MAYTPNPYETSQPTEDKFVATAAAEIRGLKGALALVTGAGTFIGEWNTLTGPATKGSTVFHVDTTYLLLSDVADITLETPGVSAVWFAEGPSLRIAGGTMAGHINGVAGAAGAQLIRADEANAVWDTAGRPLTPTAGKRGFNTTLSSHETWDGAEWVPDRGLIYDLPVTGSNLDLLDIPAWVRTVEISFAALSSTDNTDVTVRIGSASGFLSTGYILLISGTVQTNGFSLGYGSSSSSRNGRLTLTKRGAGNLFYAAGHTSDSVVAIGCTPVAGVQGNLPGRLDRLRITTVGGTATFDSGFVTVVLKP